MARFLTRRGSARGNTVLDPFCGSGSVLIEAILAGRDAIGVDSNPLAVVLATAKTNIYDTKLLKKQLIEILSKFEARSPPFHQLDYRNARFWFTDATLRKLGTIRGILDEYSAQTSRKYGSFWRAVASSIIRPSSRADTRGPKPFISKKAKKDRFGRHFDSYKLFEKKALQAIDEQRSLAEAMEKNHSKARAHVIMGDARHLTEVLAGERVDSVITSPPYLNAQDYYRSSKLQILTMGLAEPEELKVWSKQLVGSDRIDINDGKLSDKLPTPTAERVKARLLSRGRRNAFVFSKYVQDMDIVIGSFANILRSGSHCAIGSAYNLMSGVIVPTPRVIVELAIKNGFHLSAHYADEIRDRWVPTIRSGHDGVMELEHILLFRKRKSTSKTPN